eukprot:4366783-Pyramimonas_sp.AAC.1
MPGSWPDALNHLNRLGHGPGRRTTSTSCLPEGFTACRPTGRARSNARPTAARRLLRQPCGARW